MPTTSTASHSAASVTPDDYQALRAYLEHPRPVTITDWPEFVHPHRACESEAEDEHLVFGPSAHDRISAAGIPLMYWVAADLFFWQAVARFDWTDDLHMLDAMRAAIDELREAATDFERLPTIMRQTAEYLSLHSMDDDDVPPPNELAYLAITLLTAMSSADLRTLLRGHSTSVSLDSHPLANEWWKRLRARFPFSDAGTAIFDDQERFLVDVAAQWQAVEWGTMPCLLQLMCEQTRGDSYLRRLMQAFMEETDENRRRQLLYFMLSRENETAPACLQDMLVQEAPDSPTAQMLMESLITYGFTNPLRGIRYDTAVAMLEWRGRLDGPGTIYAIRAVYRNLEHIGHREQLFEHLKKWCQHDDSQIRHVAIGCLSFYVGNEEADDLLRQFLNDADTYSRDAALGAISKGAVQFIPDLQRLLDELLVEPKHSHLLANAISACTTIADPQVFPLLQRVLLAPLWGVPPDTRAVLEDDAVAGIVEFGGKEAAMALEALLPSVRERGLLVSLLVGLAKLGQPSTLPHLELYMTHECRIVRHVALYAVGCLRSPESLAVLEREWRKGTIYPEDNSVSRRRFEPRMSIGAPYGLTGACAIAHGLLADGSEQAFELLLEIYDASDRKTQSVITDIAFHQTLRSPVGDAHERLFARLLQSPASGDEPTTFFERLPLTEYGMEMLEAFVGNHPVLAVRQAAVQLLALSLRNR